MQSAPRLSATLEADLAGFEDWLVGFNLSTQTVEARVRGARRFLAEWGTWEVRPSVVATSLRRHDGWTARTYFNHMRSAFTWAVETGRADVDPTARMKAPPTPRPVPKPLDSETLQRVVDAATGRPRAYMLLAFLAGLRAHEIAKLRGEDVTASGLHVVGKGGKVATVPTHPALWALAQDYPRQGPWFPSHMRPGQPVGREAVSEAVRLHLRAHGVTTGTIHQFRAAYGTELLRGGANIRVVQVLMRHGSLSSTEHYLGVTEQERSTAVAGLEVAGGAQRTSQAADQPGENIPDFIPPAACPWWCERPEGHPYSSGLEQSRRVHSRRYGHGVSVEGAFEEALGDGPEVLVSSRVCVESSAAGMLGRCDDVAAALAAAGTDLVRLGLAAR